MPLNLDKPVPPPPPGTSPLIAISGGAPTIWITPTEATRQVLLKLGWKDGEPIPAEFGKTRAGLCQQAGMTTDANHLPPDIARALRQLLDQAKQVFADEQRGAARKQQIDTRIGNLSPELQDAARVAVEAEMAYTGPTSAVAEPQSVIGDPAGDIEWEPPTVTPVQPSTGPAAQTAANQDIPPETGANKPLRQCPRCSWDMAQKFDIEPTQAQRDRFIATVLGITERFTERYPIFNGRGLLVFRSLTSSETDLIFEQLSYDRRAGELDTPTDYLIQMQRYRLVVSLAELADDSGRCVRRNPPLAQLQLPPGEPGKRTQLVSLLPWFNQNILPGESVRHVAGQCLYEFQRLVETMEAQTREPDFWKGIGPQP